MNNKETALDSYNNDWYHPGRSKIIQIIWFLLHPMLITNPFLPFSGLRVWVLRSFGAKIGKGVTIKPGVQIKYPWRLIVGDYVWIGENVWIDNLANVHIESHCCLSQGAMLLTGNHNYKNTTFDLIIGEIFLEKGAWVGAKAMVCPKVTVKSHAVLSACSVATKDLEPYTIYTGNPAVAVRKREIN
jgi:putative colanic acid biosynthesis acetyltransferase WcaF